MPDIIEFMRRKTSLDVDRGRLIEARMFGSNYGKWPNCNEFPNMTYAESNAPKFEEIGRDV